MEKKQIQVLLLEDEGAHAEAIRRALESSGQSFVIEVVNSLKQFREHVISNPPDIALLDMVLPDGNGIDLLSHPPESNAFPMLILTSHGDEKAAVTALQSGALDYIVKSPDSFTAMPRILHRVWNQWSLIQERKKAEQALRESEEKYRLIVEKSNDVLFTFNAVGELMYISPSIKNILGYNQADLIGHKLSSLVYPEDMPRLEKVIERNIKDGSQTPGGNRYRIHDSVGKWRWHNVSGNAVYDEKGKFLYFIAITRDITEHKLAEEALIASEVGYRRLFESAKDGILIIDAPTGLITDANPFLNNLLGLSLKEIKGKELWQIGTFQDIVSSKSRFEELRSKGYVRYEDLPLKTADGRKIAVEFVSNVYRVDHHSVVQCNIRDISERKHAEETLKVSEQNFRNSMDSSTIGVRISDAKNNHLYANQAMMDIFGYKDAEEIKANPPQNFYTPETYAAYELRHEKFLRGETMPNELEIDIKRKDGAVRNLQMSMAPVFWNGQPQYQILYNDITDLKQAIAARQESEEKYRMIVENSRDTIFTVNMAEEFVYVSPSVKTMLGYDSSDLVGKPFISLIHPDDRYILEKEIKLTYTSGYKNSADSEYRVRNASGDWRWVVSRGNRVTDNSGKFLYFIGIIIDVSERKAAEEERRRLEDKAQVASRLAAVGEMVAGVAHEINNPLTGVLGFSRMLAEKPDVPPDIKENLLLIAEGSQRVADIIKRLLTFSRQTKPLRTMTNLNELIENTLKLREYVLKTANITIVTELDPDLPWTLVDPGQMQQVFINLIVNAEQAMKKEHGKGTLTIMTEKKGDEIRVIFKDDGPGISRGNMVHIFEPFFTTKAVGEGTGLGLSLSRSIVLEHGGKMSVESENGHGAMFIIELPLDDAVPDFDKNSVNAIPTIDNRRSRILVIDDELVVRILFNKVLTGAGYEVETTADAADALKKLAAGEKYDVIITDIRMPGMSGTELYSQIIAKSPGIEGRIIIITGDATAADVKAFIAGNKLPYLIKPFNITDLKAQISKILDKQV